jgi:hypothetical protein
MVEFLMVEVVRSTWGVARLRQRQVVETEPDTTAERHITMAVVMEVGFVVVMAALE